MKGKFITIEGGEGAGKSTCLGDMLAILDDSGIDYLHTREPGGTAIGEAIRHLLLDRANQEMQPNTELLLMFASRAQLVGETLRPALEAGKWVVSDRFVDASFAYQGGGRQIETEQIAELEQFVIGNLKPDLTLLLDVPARIGLKRAVAGRDADRLEVQDEAFYDRVRSVYRQRAQAEPERFRVIDSSQPLDRVRDSVKAVVTEFVAANGKSS